MWYIQWYLQNKSSIGHVSTHYKYKCVSAPKAHHLTSILYVEFTLPQNPHPYTEAPLKLQQQKAVLMA